MLGTGTGGPERCRLAEGTSRAGRRGSGWDGDAARGSQPWDREPVGPSAAKRLPSCRAGAGPAQPAAHGAAIGSRCFPQQPETASPHPESARQPLPPPRLWWGWEARVSPAGTAVCRRGRDLPWRGEAGQREQGSSAEHRHGNASSTAVLLCSRFRESQRWDPRSAAHPAPSSRAGTPVPGRLPCFTPGHPHVPPFQNHPSLLHGEGGSHSGRRGGRHLLRHCLLPCSQRENGRWTSRAPKAHRRGRSPPRVGAGAGTKPLQSSSARGEPPPCARAFSSADTASPHGREISSNVPA